MSLAPSAGHTEQERERKESEIHSIFRGRKIASSGGRNRIRGGQEFVKRVTRGSGTAAQGRGCRRERTAP